MSVYDILRSLLIGKQWVVHLLFIDLSFAGDIVSQKIQYACMEEIDIELYETANGKRPFEIWIKDIKEIHTRAKILTRLDRLKFGNFGDCKTL